MVAAITGLRLTNLRTFEDLRLPLGGLTVLIGGAGTGKSTILDALEFLEDGAERALGSGALLSRRDIRHGAGSFGVAVEVTHAGRTSVGSLRVTREDAVTADLGPEATEALFRVVSLLETPALHLRDHPRPPVWSPSYRGLWDDAGRAWQEILACDRPGVRESALTFAGFGLGADLASIHEAPPRPVERFRHLVAVYEGRAEPVPVRDLSWTEQTWLGWTALRTLNRLHREDPEGPSLLILDTPERNLAPECRAIAMDVLVELAERRPVVVATNDTAMLDALGENVQGVVLLMRGHRGAPSAVRRISPGAFAGARARNAQQGLGAMLRDSGRGFLFED